MIRPAKTLSWLAAVAVGIACCAASASASTQLLTSNIDWSYLASTGNVHFHMRFTNPDPAASLPATGMLAPQMYGAFEPDLLPTRSFDIPSIAPGGFFDVFTDIPLAQLPPSAPTSGGPAAGSPAACSKPVHAV